MIRIVSLLWLLLLSMTNSLAYAEDPFIKIGVLSHRGDTFTLNSWGPTARYLTNKLPDYDFEIIPLDFDEVDSAVKNDEVDFILVNPGIYVNLEYKYRVSRLGTMYNLRGDDAYKVFGGVIFTRKDREDIQTLEDLHGKSFMAVDATSLGGFQMAWRELQAKGINPYEDFSKLEFGGIHDHVVRSVINGEIDAGTVRTDILERMSNTAGLDLSQVRIINPQTDSNFPFRLSTRLYPEWPFSKLQKTSDELAKKVALALFAMPKEHPAALAGKYAVWDLPLDYQQVHELFQELRLPPYDQIGKFTVKDVVKKYWYWGVAAAIILLGMGVLTSAVVRRNKRLKRIQLRMERHYERLLDSVGDGIYGVDLNGNCTFANKATENITGWKVEQLVGKNQHTILHHSHADGTHYPVEECPVYKTTNDSLPRFIDDDIFWKADGSTISVEYSCTPIKGPRNTTIGSAVVFRDITQRELVKKKTIEHQLQLFHVARLSTLGEMASGIAHELNQPLTVINNYSRACIRMLGSKDSTDESMQDQCSEVMEKISKQAERAGAVIKQIRHFVNKDLPDKKPVKVSEMLDVVLELTHMEIERKMVTLQLDIDDSVEWVLAQDTQIEQVIINLVRNAVEAMEDTPEGQRNLIIKTENQQDDKLKISISDSGTGIDKEVVEQLFDPFITTKEQGMGLGLSISQGIIETHNDKIIIEDNLEGGVSFSFKLPIVKSPKLEKENNKRKTKNKEVA